MIKVLLAYTLVLLGYSKIYAQEENSRWYFGDHAGLHFTPNGPVALTDGASYGHDGTASVSTPDGNLLFYSNAESIWNRNHQIMVNGHNIEGSHTSTHAATIVPQPDVASIYYLFTTDREGWTKGLKYHVIDIEKQNGLGEVISKNNTLYPTVTEKIISIRHSNGKDVWVLAHGFGNSEFLAYLVTSTGINTTPIISNVGPIHGISGGFAWGQMKCSPDGSKLAMGVLSGNRYELYDFNASTGTVSNPLQIFNEANAYGVEFSPSGRYLYTARLNHTSIYQYDLQAGGQEAILASKTTIGTATVPSSSSPYSIACMQIGPDAKIYVTKWESPYLAVITNPNLAGLQSGFVDNGVHLGGKLSLGGLSNAVLPRNITTSMSSVESNGVKLFPNPASSYVNLEFKLGRLMQSGNVQVVDLLGREVYSGEIAQISTLSTAGWAKGLYLVKISVSGTQWKAPLIIE